MSEAQQVNVADLDLSQLGDVRKQLEEVRKAIPKVQGCSNIELVGARPPYQLICPAEASASEIQDLH